MVLIARNFEPSVGFLVMNLFLPFVFNLWGPYHRYMGLHMFIALKHVLATFISCYCPSYVCSKGESINRAVDKKGVDWRKTRILTGEVQLHTWVVIVFDLLIHCFHHILRREAIIKLH